MSHQTWLEAPYQARYAADERDESIIEQATDGLELDCGHDSPTDPEVTHLSEDRYAWDATVRFRCADCDQTTDVTVGDEADFEAIAEARADARLDAIQAGDEW